MRPYAETGADGGFLAALWRGRRAAALKETLLYVQYAFRGGLSMFLLAAFITGAYYYGKALQTLDPGFPYWRVAVPLLLLAVSPSPVRTYIREADLVFLLPAETRMGRYLNRCVASSYLSQSIIGLFVLLVIWPLYMHCRGVHADPFSLAAGWLLVLKAGHVAGSWQETRMRRSSHRNLARTFRWIFSLIILYAGFVHSIQTSFIPLLLALIALGICYWAVPKESVPWETLIRAEQAALAVRHQIFNWFADVPGLSGRTRRRGYLAWVAGRIRFGRETSFLYLYAITLLRSELAGMIIRLTLAAIVLIILLPSPLAGAAAAALLAAMTAMQLSSLAAAHRASIWPKLYPLPLTFRVAGLHRLAAATLAAQAVVLAAVLLISSGSAWLALALLLWGVGFAYVYGSSAIRRKLLSQL